VIVWINGAFGAGMASTARELIGLIPDSTLYDPGSVGEQLRRQLPRKRLEEVADVRELPIWRRLVVETAAAVHAEVGGTLVVPMTLLRQEHRDEIFGGLAARRVPVRHVLLHPEETVLRNHAAGPAGASPAAGRNGARPSAGAAEQEAPDPYPAAVEDWIRADAFVVGVGTAGPLAAAVRIADAVRSGEAAVCEIVQTPPPTGETLAAGVLLFDAEDRVLLVDPTYKPGWEFPGGVVESGEAPARAGMREVTEELGIELDRVPRLLLVDWEPPRPPWVGGLRLLFDGGRLSGEDADRVRLPGDELRAWRFVGESEAARLLPPPRYERLRWALRARERGTVLNLEAGVPVG
jgi:8-oxo-dGTP pyrophosphatase MutT (NUDIX family)